MIRAIAAIDAKRGLADDQGIPWQGKLPTDAHYFRDQTMNSTVLMGASTYEEFARPLPSRRNLVASRHLTDLRPGFELISDVQAFLRTSRSDIWVIGGASLFSTTLDQIEELYLTVVSGDFNGTKFFPSYEEDFKLAKQSELQVENDISFTFNVYQRQH